MNLSPLECWDVTVFECLEASLEEMNFLRRVVINLIYLSSFLQTGTFRSLAKNPYCSNFISKQLNCCFFFVFCPWHPYKLSSVLSGILISWRATATAREWHERTAATRSDSDLYLTGEPVGECATNTELPAHTHSLDPHSNLLNV